MVKVKLNKTQVEGEVYQLPAEEIEVHKLIKRGLSLQKKVNMFKDSLEGVKNRLIEIAEARRDNQTTVKLKGVTGQSKVTFRESWEAGENTGEIEKDLGELFNRFFTLKKEYSTSKELKAFMEGKNNYGLENPDPVRELVLSKVKKKVIKPNVKLIADDAV